MDGLCDVKGCSEATYLGWRPLTDRRGRQICEHHWRRHRDKKDNFDLFDEFKFRYKKNRQIEPVIESALQCKQCGGHRLPNHIYCPKCAEHRKITTRRQAQSRYWRKQHNVAV